ncbi:hypothetical protein BB561_001081 [Smittium simulii]|uniref:Uncharacterized protein n=1 Tax=Smittium simulii TaxID=133385 RepID=A0A2T9YWA8_9FUNG|nr:hypothetical protein BB561_001081 [Smittium simulii]
MDTPPWLEPFMEFIPGHKIKLTMGAFFNFTNMAIMFSFDSLAANNEAPMYFFGKYLLLGLILNLIGHFILGNNKPAFLEKKYYLIPLYSTVSMINFMMILGYRPFLFQEIKEQIILEDQNITQDGEKKPKKA